MGLLDSSEIQELIRQAQQTSGQTSGQTSSQTGTTSTSTPEPSAFRDYLFKLAENVGGLGGEYSRIIERDLPGIRAKVAAAGDAPEYDNNAARQRADSYARLVEGFAGPTASAGMDRLRGGGPASGVIRKLYDTAENPIDDELETYFRGNFEKDTDSELARLGLVGQGRGEDLKFDARNRYAMDRREGADTRRINAGNAAMGLSGSNLDQALKSLGASGQFAGSGYAARDSAEKYIYDTDMAEWTAKRAAPYEDLARTLGIGKAQGELLGMPASIYGSLYAIDQGRLNRGGTTTQNLSSVGSGTQSGTQSGSDSSNKNIATNPSVLGSTSDVLKLLPQVTQAASNFAPLAKDGADWLKSLFNNNGSGGGGSITGDPYDPSGFGF